MTVRFIHVEAVDWLAKVDARPSSGRCVPISHRATRGLLYKLETSFSLLPVYISGWSSNR